MVCIAGCAHVGARSAYLIAALPPERQEPLPRCKHHQFVRNHLRDASVLTHRVQHARIFPCAIWISYQRLDVPAHLPPQTSTRTKKFHVLTKTVNTPRTCSRTNAHPQFRDDALYFFDMQVVEERESTAPSMTCLPFRSSHIQMGYSLSMHLKTKSWNRCRSM